MTQREHIPTARPAALAPPAGQLWPTVIGVVSMVIGLKTALSRGGPGGFDLTFAVVNWLMIGAFLRPTGAPVVLVALQVLRGAMALMLIAAGYLLWRRRRGAAALHVVYAVVTLPRAVAMLPLAYWAGGAHAWGMRVQVGYTLPAAAYPLFLIVWFWRPKVRQQVRCWRAGAVPQSPPGSVWPTALGAVSIVLGGLALFRNLWNLGTDIWMSFLPTQSLQGRLVLRFAAGIVLATLLLASGWLLHRRRLLGAAGHLLYAVLAGVCGLAWPLWTLLRSGYWRHAGNLGAHGYYFLILASWAASALIYPAFVLAWFLRPKIRQQVRTWRSAGRPGRVC